MDTPATELQLLANRIAKLERQNRFWKIGGVLAALALAALESLGSRAGMATSRAACQAD